MNATILLGDVRERLSELPDSSVQTCVTSPPYFGLRDYGHDGQIGQEPSPSEFVAVMVDVFREVHRVLRADGTLWLNLGDSYAGSGKGRNADGTSNVDPTSKQATSRGTTLGKLHKATTEGLKPKDLMGIPWRVAFALQDAGWYLRQDIIWHKPNAMPSSVADRCTTSHEYLFLFAKSSRYYYDAAAIKEPAVTGRWGRMPPIGGVKQSNGNDNATYSGNRPAGDGTRNKRSVWTVPTRPFKGAHFAVMPEALVEPCVLAASRQGDIILDPFTGSGTVAVVSLRHGRKFVGTELNPEYAEIARDRITSSAGIFADVHIDRGQVAS